MGELPWKMGIIYIYIYTVYIYILLYNGIHKGFNHWTKENADVSIKHMVV